MPAAKRLTPVQREARARKRMRLTAIVAGIPVGAVALYNSYFHIVKLSVEHSQSQTASHLGPVSIDGMMLVASVVVVARPGNWMARVSFALGAMLTLGANVWSVGRMDPWGLILAGSPAVASIMSALMIEGLCLPARPKRKKRRKPATIQPQAAKRPVRVRARTTELVQA